MALLKIFGYSYPILSRSEILIGEYPMELRYLVEIMDPKTHMVNVKISGIKPKEDRLVFFLPSWSPGSYLMREYSRHVRTFSAFSGNGEFIKFEQVTKGQWEVDFTERI